MMLSLTISSLSACETTSTNNDICLINDVQPDPGFQTRWTHNEKVQVEQLDELLDKECHR
jgi:hypothetical protein